MYIQVKLLNGYKEPLWYHVPKQLQESDLIGSIVRVPIRNQISSALVVYVNQDVPTNVHFAIKEIKAIEPFSQDLHYNMFIKQLSYYYQIDKLHFLKRMSSISLIKNFLNPLFINSNTVY